MSIEKHTQTKSFMLEKEANPFTQINNIIINNITFMEAGWIYLYLLSKPANWIVVKEQLKNHFKIGDDKLKRIFSFLFKSNLLEYVQVKNTQGQFEQTKIRILNGSKFKIITENAATMRAPKESKDVQTAGSISTPPEIHTSGDRALQIKIYKNKERTQTKKDQKLLRSSTDEPPLFTEFWSIYLRKQKREMALAEWKKRNCEAIGHLIINHVKHRNENEWKGKEKQYIPLPDTFIRQQRHLDELINATESKEHPVTASIRSIKEKLKGPAYHDLLS